MRQVYGSRLLVRKSYSLARETERVTQSKAIEHLSKLIAAEVRNPSDALVVQAKVFLEDIFTA